MPYIPRQDRAEGREPVTAGGLNFKLTETIIRYLILHGLSYQTCNDIVGALDNCKDEFRRRVQHQYEDKKIEENGDCYPKEVTGNA